LNGLFKVIIAVLDSEAYWVRDDDIKSFVLTYEELAKSKNLYKTYIVSLLATADPSHLASNSTYRDDDNTSSGLHAYIMEFKYCVVAKKLYKGNYFDYFDDRFYPTFGFNSYPTHISIDDIEANDAMKKHYIELFENDENYIVSFVNTYTIDNFISDNIEKYIDRYTNYIECDIVNMENNNAYISKYKLFVDKVCKHKNIMNDINLYILRNVCKTVLDDSLDCISSVSDDNDDALMYL